jgi:hypothetical protein
MVVMTFFDEVLEVLDNRHLVGWFSSWLVVVGWWWVLSVCQ